MKTTAVLASAQQIEMMKAPFQRSELGLAA
jgi:hypothetical protein